MAGVRGRPRKVQLPEPIAIAEEVAKMEAQPETLAPVAPLGSPVNNYGIIKPMDVKPTRERFAHVLDMLKPYAERGFLFTADDVSVTITKGRCSECLNVTNTDAEFKRALNRVAVAAASASGRSVIE